MCQKSHPTTSGSIKRLDVSGAAPSARLFHHRDRYVHLKTLSGRRGCGRSSGVGTQIFYQRRDAQAEDGHGHQTYNRSPSVHPSHATHCAIHANHLRELTLDIEPWRYGRGSLVCGPGKLSELCRKAPCRPIPPW